MGLGSTISLFLLIPFSNYCLPKDNFHAKEHDFKNNDGIRDKEI